MSPDLKRLGGVAVALTAVVATGLVVSPVQAEPDIDEVRAKVDRLYHEAEQAQERYHDANLRLEELTEELGSLKADEKRQDARLQVVREQVQESIVRQYQGESISTVGQVVVSEDPSAFLGQLSTMSAFNDLQNDLFDSFTTEAEALGLREEATRERRAEISSATAQLAEEKEAVETRLAEAKRLLGRLEAEEREELQASRSGFTRLPSSVPASGRAAAAVKAALAQVGDAYVYGAVGPDAYDCSGLTMMAWGAAGVGLPHSSSAQFGSGTRVAQSDLQPGDLVFYYSPISHVGMYIGNGLIVHAANPSSGVRVDGVFSMPYVGAVRPG
ncbi:C40 family peptidase [Nocardioides solisilvae]|uniref:C40 family peptidase n=1 Tax=Nocardioides solisilvae TaxID=1542435 RepID=UPI000D74CFE7|nr:NlpC/P60 family protein [Nocardioides solisilvae]